MHELGHIIIPWHLGTFIDKVDENNVTSNTEYWVLEREANRFASELLLPLDWIYSLYQRNPDPHFLYRQICSHCGVSDMAASIRIGKAVEDIEHILMPTDLILQLYRNLDDLAEVQNEIVNRTKLSPKIVAQHMVQDLTGKLVFCIESDGIVISGGSTKDTHSFTQWEGQEFIKQPYQYYQKYFVSKLNNINTHWWDLNNSFNIRDDNRSWREILEKIVYEILPTQGIDRFKKTVNSKLSGIYGNWIKKNPSSGVEKFINDAIERFDEPEYVAFVQHQDFLFL
ncbi:MAG: ImmA/IrrE family metallo-endopeptidase [Segetibacter sp.]